MNWVLKHKKENPVIALTPTPRSVVRACKDCDETAPLWDPFDRNEESDG